GPPIKEVQSIRVGTDRLDALVNLVGEMVINKSRLSQIASEADQEPLNNALTALERLLRDLQDLGMSMRLVKVAHVFDRFPRMVRDLAKEMGKDVEFTVEGKEIELDRTVLDRLGDPLVHLLRNCIDHGIEPPEEREKNGKPKKGVVKLSARRIKDHVEIAVEDDGRGINPEELKKAAVRKGFLSSKEAEKLNEEEAIDLIFKPGFSGAKKVTDVSGRGVGMDVVKNMVTKLGGSIQVSSTKGKGSVLSLKLPLSLAIIKVLLVEVKDDVYAIPTKNVVEVLSCKNFKIKTVKGKEAIVHRREPLPVLRLGKILNSYNGEPTKDSKFIVVEKFNKKIGLAVERVLRQEEVVIKSLGEGLTNIAGISGATILGNGKVALILDVYNLV
ncbi:MAG: chemotaxis protein CheA, partial [Candidatus Hydrothermarchaeales archaeon]